MSRATEAWLSIVQKSRFHMNTRLRSFPRRTVHVMPPWPTATRKAKSSESLEWTG